MEAGKYHTFPRKAEFWLIVTGIPLVSLLNNTLLFGFLLQEGKITDFSKCLLVSFGFTCMYWITFRYIFFYFIRRFPHEKENKMRRVFTFSVQMVVFIIFQFFVEKIMLGLKEFSFTVADPNFFLKVLTTFIFTVLVISLYEIIYLSYQISNSIKEREELKRENIASELSGLKEQINPHFLFNSLNTLSALILTHPQRAETFVLKLARVYRYILDKGSENMVTVAQEINYLETYVQLLKERFGDGLQVETEQFNEAIRNKKVVPLSFQICFENCVKHNMVNNEKPLVVTITSTTDGYIRIQNNLQPLQLKEPGSGVGILNIRKRFSFFTQKPVLIENDGQFYSIYLPLI